MARRSPHQFFFVLAIVAAALICAVLIALKLHWYAAWLVGAGIVTFAAYGFDKKSAQVGGQRIPENVLHALSLLGGVLGGWAGRNFWQHKTQHPSFLVVLSLSSIIHGALAVWLLG
jgi:uncharacterized membrane protein YsdA (DUF1294 family)